MNLAFRKPMSLAEFLAWEERQKLRYEFNGVRPIERMTGTVAHAGIQRNLTIAIGGRLRGSPHKFLGSSLKVEVAGRIRYPDGFVICAPIPPRSTIAHDPVVIFKVLSESTARTDIVSKHHEYAATPSVQRYVILAQDEIGGTMFERIDGDWVGHVLGADAVLRMPEIGVEVPLAEFYEGVELPARDADHTEA